MVHETGVNVAEGVAAGADQTAGAPVGIPEEIASGKPRHFACFDGLRAISAVSILLCHTAWVSGFTSRSFFGAYTSRLDVSISVFFMISGFLMYRPFAVSHLSERQSPNLSKYFERRLLRIIPAYWLALTVLTYVMHLITLGPGWQGVVIHYLLLQNYFPGAVFYGITQAWTLCVEMSFYFFLPLFAYLVVRRRGRRPGREPRHQLAWELGGVATLYVFSVAFRCWALLLPLTKTVNGRQVELCSPHCFTQPAYASLLPDWLPSYLDVFALGMLLAVVSAWYAERRTESPFFQRRLFPWASWFGAFLLFILVSHVMSDHNILYVANLRINLERQGLEGAIAFLLLLPAVFGPQDTTLIRRALRSWPLASLGVISYGLYLWHLNLITQVQEWTGWHDNKVPFWLLSVAVLGVTIPFAAASYFGLERPLLRLKNRIRWWDGPKAPPPVPGVPSEQPDVAMEPT
jgi:peptidoglycan/LPS O-acetylase OafA/YrhL